MTVSVCTPSSVFIPSTAARTSSKISCLSSCKSVLFNDGQRGVLKLKSDNAIASIRGRRAQRGLNVRCLFGLGVPELLVVAGVAALVFGPKKLPEIGRSVGKTVKSFQQAAKEFETELKKAPEDATEALEKPATVSEQEKSAEKPAAMSKGEKQDLEILGRKETL